MTKKMIEFKIWTNNEFKTTRVNVLCAKNRINYDCEFDTNADIYEECERMAIEKLYGKRRCFIRDNSGIVGRGQIWKALPTGGYSSVTGIIFLESNIDQ